MTPARLNLEKLEDRATPTVSISQNGNLYIESTNQADTVIVRNVTVNSVRYFDIQENATISRIKRADITGPYVYFIAKDGNDRFENHSTLTAVAYGGKGNDYLLSGVGGFLEGEDGNDTLIAAANSAENFLSGGNGDDLLIGGSTRDLLYGDEGNDNVYGGDGDDYLEGGAGNDFLDGGQGAEVIYGDAGNDILIAGNDASPNQLDGGAGLDRIFGGYGADTIWVGEDASLNYVYAGAGDDRIYGGNGIDFLFGEAGSDQLVGAGGNDRLNGGTGVDFLWGEAGNDYLDGGIDGVADYLDGGAGKDWFRREWFRSGSTTSQRERMPEFVIGLDELYT
jgi:Ca2+-binding RTX toxin-like protein